MTIAEVLEWLLDELVAIPRRLVEAFFDAVDGMAQRWGTGGAHG